MLGEILSKWLWRRRKWKWKFHKSGAGRKRKAPKVRDAMLEWFINVRGVLNGRLPKKMFRRKCQKVYSKWLKQQPETIPDEKQLKFSKHWIQDRVKEYKVSLGKPNKRFAIKNEDRIIRIRLFTKYLDGKKVFFGHLRCRPTYN